MQIIKTIVVVFLVAIGCQKAYSQKGALYQNFPESFELTDQQIAQGYAKKYITFSTGKWWFNGALVDSTGNDRATSGQYAVRFNKNNTNPLYLEMDFDVKSGASKVIFWYSSYGAKADKHSSFQLEQSTDGGKKWHAVGDVITTKFKHKQAATYKLDISGNVRFRVCKLPLGNGDVNETIENGRLSIDDFSIYKN